MIDFRDPDCTMTHFRNPDVKVVLGSIAGTVYTPTYLAPINPPGNAIPAGATAIPLDQYGMEYNPIAINEAMAYSFAINTGATGQLNRFFVELVNTLSQSAIALLPPNDFGTTITNPPDVSTLDLSLANYDMVITADDKVSRPDPFTGQLLPIFKRQILRADSVQPGKPDYESAESAASGAVHPGIAHSLAPRRPAAYAAILGWCAQQPANGQTDSGHRLSARLLLRDRQPAGRDNRD